MAKQSKLKKAQEETRENLNKLNNKIVELGGVIENSLSDLKRLQNIFNKIRNVSEDKKQIYNQVFILQTNWENEVTYIEEAYDTKIKGNIIGGGGGGAVGIGIAAFGPQVAMGVATTFGVASTSTAISALNGVAATNAALAWLGGGALAAGGGGMELGSFLLTLAGPVGWSIGLVSLSIGGYLLWSNIQEKNRLSEIYTLISLRDSKKYKLGFLDVEERIKHISKESKLIQEAIPMLESFGADYNAMTEEQQYTLGTYVNLMYGVIELFIKPIEGLIPKVTDENINRFLLQNPFSELKFFSEQEKNLVISLGNFLNEIYLSSDDMELVEKNLKGNKDFLKSINMDKKAFSLSMIEFAKRISKY